MAVALPAALPAAGISMEIAKSASDTAKGALEAVLAWAAKPLYQDTKTTSRTWVEIDKHGRAHSLTETKTRGYAITNGLVLGSVIAAAAWEIGNEFAAALGGSAKSLEGFMNPALWVVQEVQSLTGGVKTVSVPPTAMGTFSQLLTNLLAVPAASAGQLSAKVIAQLQTPP